MSQNVLAEDIVNYFLDHVEDLSKEYQMVASNEEQGVEIYIAEENDFPCFSVDVDGKEVCAIKTCSLIEAEVTYEELYAMYVCPDDEFSDEDKDCDNRRNEIDSAIEDLLTVLIQEDPYEAGLKPIDIDNIASIVEQYLFDECNISVQHPMRVDGAIVQYPFGDPEDEDGDEDEDNIFFAT